MKRKHKITPSTSHMGLLLLGRFARRGRQRQSEDQDAYDNNEPHIGLILIEIAHRNSFRLYSCSSLYHHASK
jgi:hypothetical protein